MFERESGMPKIKINEDNVSQDDDWWCKGEADEILCKYSTNQYKPFIGYPFVPEETYYKQRYTYHNQH